MPAHLAISGNIGKMELKFSSSGRAFASFSVASEDNWKDKEGEWQKKTSWFSCIAWNELGERLAESLEKGNRVVVIGKLEVRTWEKDDGTTAYVTELNVSDAGPSCLYATAEVTRIDREGTQSRSTKSNDSRQGQTQKKKKRPPAPIENDLDEYDDLDDDEEL
jgi:single-strand DNA-binding protein